MKTKFQELYLLSYVCVYDSCRASKMRAYIAVSQGLETALQCVETRLLPLLLLAEPLRNPVALLHERCVTVLQEKPDYK